MDPSVENKIAQQLIDGISTESLLNREDSDKKPILPFGFYNPETEGRVTWICDTDAEGKITSVFGFKDGPETHRNIAYVTMDQALNIRNELISSNWRKIVPPKIKFTYPGQGEKELNRKQKRYLQRKIEQIKEQNPFIKRNGE